ncbi:hypothetical protein F6Y04_00620 [Bacillus megaterium]|nr:hypothetical protein [Priestia megaterium]
MLKMLEAGERKPKPKRKAFSRDMRIAVNTIRQSLSMVENSGCRSILKKKSLTITIKLRFASQKNNEVTCCLIKRG